MALNIELKGSVEHGPVERVKELHTLVPPDFRIWLVSDLIRGKTKTGEETGFGTNGVSTTFMDLNQHFMRLAMIKPSY